MQADTVRLTFHDGPPRPDECVRRSFRGFSVEHVRMHSSRAFDYCWKGDANYLALHDIGLTAGEISIGGEVSASCTNLRDRLTFVPRLVDVSGWSDLASDRQGYIAMFFDPDLAEVETERPLLGVSSRPLLYFKHAQLTKTLCRVARLLSEPTEHDPLAAESLCLLAVLQLYPLLGLSLAPKSGQLDTAQQNLIKDYVEAHLSNEISLSNLAAVAGKSRFHFARSFLRTFGLPPHQYVLRHRIGLAATFLATTDTEIATIAAKTGFSSPARLSTAFRRMSGMTPRSFRRATR